MFALLLANRSIFELINLIWFMQYLYSMLIRTVIYVALVG